MGEVRYVDQVHPSRESIDEAVVLLNAGGVLVMPTDSVYGIGCAAILNNPAHERIFAIKERPRSMALPWLIADAGDLMRFSRELTPTAAQLAATFWPGPLTVVVNASSEVAPEYTSPDGSIALRLPNSQLVRELARRCGCALATTSANTHGEEAAISGESVEPALVAAVDLTLDAGPAPIAIASTIVDARDTHPKILRVGAISQKAIEAALL